MRQENKYNLKVGDSIEFINNSNTKIIIPITRVEEKSIYGFNGCRYSYNTINDYIETFKAIILPS
jgi:hypothetical protein